MSSKKKNGVKRGSAQHQKFIDKLQKAEDQANDFHRFIGEIDTEQIYLMALAEDFHFGPKMFERLDESVRKTRIKWANAVLKDVESQTGKNTGFEKERDDFDKILFKHLKPEMHIPWEDRWAWDKEGNHRVRYTLGICVGPTDEQCFVMGKNAEYRQMVGLDKGEQENDG